MEPKPESDPRPPDPQEARKVEVKNSLGVVIGDYARVVVNNLDEKVFKRLGLEVQLGFVLLGLLILAVLSGVGLILYRLRPVQASMKIDPACEFCIAVAGFSESGGVDEGVGSEFAGALSSRLRENLTELETSTNLSIAVWGPAETGKVQGSTRQELDDSAKLLADRIGADVLVYGIVEDSQSAWQVTPLFYVSPNYAFEPAVEIIGQDALGLPFPATGAYKAVRIKRMNDEATPRGRMLAALVVGMTHYLTSDYPGSRDIFEIALRDAQGWGDPAANKLINLFLGNSMLKYVESTQEYSSIEQAEAYFKDALDTDPQYARAYIGLGSLAYLRAQLPAMASKNPGDLDQDWLGQSMDHYQRALELMVEPDLAHIREKAAMWMGQDYFAGEYARAFANGQAPDFSNAAAEFEKVVSAYQKSPGPTLKELAAEAHARLGLIYRLEDQTQESISQYKLAISLSDNLDRIQVYNKALATLQAP